MNEKLKKTALKLEDLILSFDTPQHVYNKLMSLCQQQPDYFGYIGPKNVINLSLLLYSYKTTNSFKLGEKMIDDSMFLFLLYSDGANHRETCEACAGDGKIDCDSCNSNGEIECPECDGEGEIECFDCNGSGVDSDDEECNTCNGSGKLDCTNCDSSGYVSCDVCNGEGLETCSNCDDIGEIETDDWDYDIMSILTWNKKLIDKSVDTQQTLVPILNYNNYIEYQDNYIHMTYISDNHLDFKKGFRPDEVYCFGYSNNPKLTFSYDFSHIKAEGPYRHLSSYE